MNEEIAKLLLAIKPDLDKARAMIDSCNDAVVKLSTSFAGDIIKFIPGAAGPISIAVSGLNVLADLVNSLDTAVDAITPPAPTTTTTTTTTTTP